MAAASLPNLFAVAVQITCIALLAGALISALRITSAGLNYVLWRGVFVVCLALPWIQTPRTAHIVIDGMATVEATPQMSAGGVGGAASAAAIDWSTPIALALGAGVAIRLAWLGVGIHRLRRLRRSGEPAPDDEHAEVQARLGTRAEVRYSARVQQPANFGLFRPVVLLPVSLRDYPTATRDAVLTHELVHVRRRDWANVLVEETVRGFVWFHPVMWWVISRVQLAREEVVDATAVALTGQRREYLRALLAFADEVPLAPAPAFARRRHLFRRIVLLSTEDLMSARRIVLSAVAVGLTVAIGSWSAVTALPLQGGVSALVQAQPGPVEQRGSTIADSASLPRRTYEEAPVFPSEAPADASATVTLRTVVDEAGNVAELRLSGFTLRIGGAFSVSMSGPDAVGSFEEFLAKATLRGSPANAPLGADALRPVLEAFIESAARAVGRSRYEPPSAARPVVFNTIVQFTSGVRAVAQDTPILDRLPSADGALRVGGNIRTPRKIMDVKAVYPPEARDAQVQGVVILEVRIEPDGRVGGARVLRSIPLLDQAALDAVQQWEFEPTLLNGSAVPVIMTVTVQFTTQ
jgi:TonB family protein